MKRGNDNFDEMNSLIENTDTNPQQFASQNLTVHEDEKTNEEKNDSETICDENEEFEELKREIREMFHREKGPEHVFVDPMSLKIEAMMKADSESIGETYKHYCGVPIESTKDGSNFTKFSLLCDKQIVEIRATADTVTQVDICNCSQQIHVLAIDIRGRSIAKVVCEEEFFEMFKLIEDLRMKASTMKQFLALTKEQQRDIEQQLNGKHFSLFEGEKKAMFRSRDELSLKYTICKDTYSPEQQRCIEALLSQRVSGRDKSTQKLDYVLNISNMCFGRKPVSRKDIICELDKHLYKLDKVKDKVATCLMASKYATERGMRILLVGHPGTGKTTIARTIAETYGIPFDIINLGCVINAIDIKGLDSSYDGADAGMLIKSFYSLGTTEAVIVLDEIDKMGIASKDGNPANALLDTLSDEHICYDAFLEMGIDTSNTIYIATANSTMGIPDYLLNRFDVIYVDDYEDEDKIVIAEKHLVPQTLKLYGLSKDDISFSHEVLAYIVKNYCSDSGARMLKNNIKTLVCNVISLWEEKQQRNKIEITVDFVKCTLENFANDQDPFLCFARNKDKFKPDVREEIRKTLDSLSAVGKDPREIETNTRRVQYLTALIPNEGDFGSFDVKTFIECVDRSHFGLDKVKQLIAKSIFSKAIQKRSFSSERLLLVGGAGVGKTSICESIATALDVPFVRVSLNGVNDESVIKGFSPTYLGADAGEIVKGLARVRTTKAVVQLDEIDKLGNHNGVKASNALFDLLDNCSTFTDRFLGVPIDLSNILFIATANDLSNVEPWLLDRFNIIQLDGYTKSDKEKILTEHLIPKIEQEYSSINLKINMTSEAVSLLIHDYCTSFGARDLEKAMRIIVSDKLYSNAVDTSIIIDSKDVLKSMGIKPLPRGNLLKENVPGFSKALAVTGDNCGMAFSIESAIIPGDNCTCITGLPKESAIDSVKLAKTFIRLRYASEAKDFGVHLHFGEGAVVKDGPSAGVAILISMLSAVFKTPVKGNVAYTGEIDLFGNVFAIGGTLAKIQAADETGCEKVFIPYDNYCQLNQEDIQKFGVEVIPVHHVSEVINVVFPSLKNHIKQH